MSFILLSLFAASLIRSQLKPESVPWRDVLAERNRGAYLGAEHTLKGVSETILQNPAYFHSFVEFVGCYHAKDSSCIRKFLRDRQFDVGAFDNYPIRYAVRKGFPKMVAWLLQLDGSSGVDPNVDQNDLLFWSACLGFENVTKVLLSDLRVDPTDRKGRAALACAIRNNNAAVLSLLLEVAEPPKDAFEIATETERNPPSGPSRWMAHDGEIRDEWGREVTEVIRVLLLDGRAHPAGLKHENLPLLQLCKKEDLRTIRLLLHDGRIFDFEGKKIRLKALKVLMDHIVGPSLPRELCFRWEERIESGVSEKELFRSVFRDLRTKRFVEDECEFSLLDYSSIAVLLLKEEDVKDFIRSREFSRFWLRALKEFVGVLDELALGDHESVVVGSRLEGETCASQVRQEE